MGKGQSGNALGKGVGQFYTGNFSGAMGSLGTAHQEWTGVADQARAAGAAAMAAEAEARRQRDETMAYARGNTQQTMDFAKASPAELRAYEGSLQAGEKQLAADQRLMDAIDPSVMEASKQILGILKGDSSGGIMAPYAAQRNQQRQQVMNQIRQRFGPGGESTAAGQKMLNDFDISANMQGAQMQQGQLGNLFGVLNNRPDMMKSGQLMSNAGQGYSALQNRLTNASLNTGNQMLAAMGSTNAAVNQTVGSQYTADLVRGRGQQQDHKTGVEFMGSLMGSGMGK